MSRLCFGTFAQVLRLCKRGGVSDCDLVGAMTRTVDPDCQYAKSTNKTAVSRLFSCEGNLSAGRSSGGSGAYTEKPGESLSRVKPLAPSADRAEIADKFAKHVVVLLDEDKKAQAVLALLEIIRSDIEIEHGKRQSFEKYLGMKKDALLAQNVFGLADLLAGLFLYTVIAVGNTGRDAKEYVRTITPEYISGLKDAAAHITVIDRLSGHEEPDAAPPVDFSGYLHSVKNLYGARKTLLYKDSPRAFYDFYVPNHVAYTAGRRKGAVLNDVTAKSLADISNFLILDGAGGLGKSMMMYHLLLNAIEDYDALRHVPVFMRIKDYDGESSLLDFIHSTAKGFSEALTKEALEGILRNGMALLLFDGLDEISGERGGAFERALEAFVNQYPNNKYVISSRPYQSFVSLSRFTVLEIQPFTKQQVLLLIDKLEFHPDEPEFKAKFRALVEKTLYSTHRSFIENPLLLTIMLLTYENFAAIPTKMHVFYRKAFETLAETHDAANKGGHKRVYKSNLTPDDLSDYLAEFCFHSYKDGKAAFSEEEFARYFDGLRINDGKFKVADFAHDLCHNLCLMYMEGGKYHFTHRSFQEYFCALFFSKQKDTFIVRLGGFFESRRMRIYGDQVFHMLYDMIPDKIESHIFIPVLRALFDACDSADGYWTFLEKVHPRVHYEKGYTTSTPSNLPESYILRFILGLLKPRCSIYCDDLLEDEGFLLDEYGYIELEDGGLDLVNLADIPTDYPWVDETPEVAGSLYMLEVEDVRRERYFDEFREILNDDEFELKSEYNALRKYLARITAKQQGDDDFFAGLL